MNGVIKGKVKSEWPFPLPYGEDWKEASFSDIDEMGRLAWSWGLSTRGTRMLRSYDGCGHHGDVGRLTFSVWSPSALWSLGLWGWGLCHLIAALPATLIPECGKTSLRLVVSLAKRVPTLCATCCFPSFSGFLHKVGQCSRRFCTSLVEENAAATVLAAVRTPELYLIFGWVRRSAREPISQHLLRTYYVPSTGWILSYFRSRPCRHWHWSQNLISEFTKKNSAQQILMEAQLYGGSELSLENSKISSCPQGAQAAWEILLNCSLGSCMCIGQCLEGSLYMYPLDSQLIMGTFSRQMSFVDPTNIYGANVCHTCTPIPTDRSTVGVLVVA